MVCPSAAARQVLDHANALWYLASLVTWRVLFYALRQIRPAVLFPLCVVFGLSRCRGLPVAMACSWSSTPLVCARSGYFFSGNALLAGNRTLSLLPFYCAGMLFWPAIERALGLSVGTSLSKPEGKHLSSRYLSFRTVSMAACAILSFMGLVAAMAANAFGPLASVWRNYNWDSYEEAWYKNSGSDSLTAAFSYEPWLRRGAYYVQARGAECRHPSAPRQRDPFR